MPLVKVSNQNFGKEVIASDKTVLLDFYADWCPTCRSIGPIIDQIAEERQDIKVAKININEEKELADRFNIKSIPSLIVMKNGEVAERSVGAKPKSAILAML